MLSSSVPRLLPAFPLEQGAAGALSELLFPSRVEGQALLRRCAAAKRHILGWTARAGGVPQQHTPRTQLADCPW